MINKRISKITMLTCLMLGGIVNAQEFYTCVPKKNTCDNSLKFSNIDELKQAIADGVAKGMQDSTKSKQKQWKAIEYFDMKYKNDIDLKLPFGQYAMTICSERIEFTTKYNSYNFNFSIHTTFYKKDIDSIDLKINDMEKSYYYDPVRCSSKFYLYKYE